MFQLWHSQELAQISNKVHKLVDLLVACIGSAIAAVNPQSGVVGSCLFLFVLMSAGFDQFLCRFIVVVVHATQTMSWGLVYSTQRADHSALDAPQGRVGASAKRRLSRSTTSKDLDMMRLLIDGGVDVNEPGSSIYTPLHSVALRERPAHGSFARSSAVPTSNDRFHQGPSIFCVCRFQWHNCSSRPAPTSPTRANC
jgi:hypothetical protein